MKPGPEVGGGRRPSFAAAAAATYGTNLATALLSLGNVLVIARTLGAQGRGDIAFLITIALLTSNLSAFGVQEANANLAGSEPGLRRRLATNSILLASLFGLASAAAVAALVTIFPSVSGELDRALLLVVLGSLPALLLKSYLSLLVQADYRFAVTNLAWILGPLVSFVANCLLAATGLLTVGASIAAWIGGQALGTLILIAYVARHGGFGRPDRGLAERSLRFGLKTHLGRFMALGNYRVDQWFLGAISGSRELGRYSVAVAWAEVLFYLPGVLVLILRPDLVRASEDEAARIAARAFRVALLLAAALAVALVLAAPALCVAVFGDEFRGSVDDLRVLALSAFGIVALELLGTALTSQRKPMLATGAISVAFAVTIALDILLIPTLGGLGAAIATTTAWSVGGLAVALVFSRALRSRLGDLVPRGDELPWFWRKLRAQLARRPGARARP